jgi:hypothetical protein
LAQDKAFTRSQRNANDDSERAPVHSRSLREQALSSKSNLRDDGVRDSIAQRAWFAAEVLCPMVPEPGRNRVGSETARAMHLSEIALRPRSTPPLRVGECAEMNPVVSHAALFRTTTNSDVLLKPGFAGTYLPGFGVITQMDDALIAEKRAGVGSFGRLGLCRVRIAPSHSKPAGNRATPARPLLTARRPRGSMDYPGSPDRR